MELLPLHKEARLKTNVGELAFTLHRHYHRRLWLGPMPRAQHNPPPLSQAHVAWVHATGPCHGPMPRAQPRCLAPHQRPMMLSQTAAEARMATSKLYRPHCRLARKTPPCPLAGPLAFYTEAAGGARGELIASAGSSPQGARNRQVWRPHGTRFAPRHRTRLSETLTPTFGRSTIRSRLAGRLHGHPLAWKNIVLGRLLALHQRSIKNRVSLSFPSQWTQL